MSEHYIPIRPLQSPYLAEWAARAYPHGIPVDGIAEFMAEMHQRIRAEAVEMWLAYAAAHPELGIDALAEAQAALRAVGYQDTE